MGKRIITQRRGRGTPTYKAHSHRWLAEIKHRKFDDIEKTASIKGEIVDLVNSRGHSSPIALIKYSNGEERYMFAPEGIRVKDFVESGANASVKKGNTLPLKNVPTGTSVYNIEVRPGDGGKLCRASGVSAKVVSNFINETVIELPSKKQKKFNPLCRATVGVIAGKGRKEKPWIKAGKRHHAMRARGKLYPRTSGVAMNAVDHPFGSGRGRQHAKVKSPSRFASPGKNVGPIRAKRSGKKR
ncbi:MAG: 50S ribosomal protein L2 [Candidatus Woesearchaeota archaeon]